MSKPTIDLSAQEAQQRVKAAKLSAQDEAYYLAFTQHFPQATFFANTSKALTGFQRQQRRLPAWFLGYRQTLAEAYAGADPLALQFAGGRRPDRWYTLSLPGLPKGKKEREAFLKGSATVQLFPIALDIQDDRYQLGICLSEEDTRIYEYQVEDIYVAYSAKEDINTYIYPIFESPAQMLSQVQAIWHGGQITQAQHTQPGSSSHKKPPPRRRGQHTLI